MVFYGYLQRKKAIRTGRRVAMPEWRPVRVGVVMKIAIYGGSDATTVDEVVAQMLDTVRSRERMGPG